MADAMNTVATQFPDNNFAIVDFPNAALKDKPANVRGLTFATNENSYLIGYMAAKMVEKQGGKQVISAVGGQEIPTVTIFIAGYEAGAKAANPDITVLKDYSQEFVQQAPCKELALDQIAKGSQVVFQVAGGCGLGALSAAADKDVWGIGVDRDQSDLGPHILTSAVKRVNTSVFDSIAVGRGRHLQGRRGLDLRPRERRRRPRQDQPRGPAGHPRRGRWPEAADHRRRDHRPDGVGRSRPPRP